MESELESIFSRSEFESEPKSLKLVDSAALVLVTSYYAIWVKLVDVRKLLK